MDALSVEVSMSEEPAESADLFCHDPIRPTPTEIEPTKELEDLVNLVRIQATNSEDRYKILEGRDKILRLRNPKVKVRVEFAVKLEGSCPDMCPEKERYMREVQRRLGAYELLAGADYEVDHHTAVKEYSRSSADQEEPLAHEMRPCSSLNLTFNYLLHNVINRSENESENLGDWYYFVWDRTRGIRKDMTQQLMCDLQAVSIMEKCARFHIHCSTRLSELDRHAFDPKLNDENLMKCLQSLEHMYTDLTLKGTRCPNEPEFRAYQILMKLNDGDILWEIQQKPAWILESPEVEMALKVHMAVSEKNYALFFRLIRKVPYMTACILHRYFYQIREQAIRSLVKAHTAPQKFNISMPMDSVRQLMGYGGAEEEEVFTYFCESHGISCDNLTNSINVKKRNFRSPEVSIVNREYWLIDSKLNVSVSEAINGAPLEPNPLHVHVPFSSFDENGYLKADILSELTSAPRKPMAKVSTWNLTQPKEQISRSLNSSPTPTRDSSVPRLRPQPLMDLETTGKRLFKAESPIKSRILQRLEPSQPQAERGLDKSVNPPLPLPDTSESGRGKSVNVNPVKLATSSRAQAEKGFAPSSRLFAATLSDVLGRNRSGSQPAAAAPKGASVKERIKRVSVGGSRKEAKDQPFPVLSESADKIPVPARELKKETVQPQPSFGLYTKGFKKENASIFGNNITDEAQAFEIRKDAANAGHGSKGTETRLIFGNTESEPFQVAGSMFPAPKFENNPFMSLTQGSVFFPKTTEIKQASTIEPGSIFGQPIFGGPSVEFKPSVSLFPSGPSTFSKNPFNSPIKTESGPAVDFRKVTKLLTSEVESRILRDVVLGEVREIAESSIKSAVKGWRADMARQGEIQRQQELQRQKMKQFQRLLTAETFNSIEDAVVRELAWRIVITESERLRWYQEVSHFIGKGILDSVLAELVDEITDEAHSQCTKELKERIERKRVLQNRLKLRRVFNKWKDIVEDRRRDRQRMLECQKWNRENFPPVMCLQLSPETIMSTWFGSKGPIVTNLNKGSLSPTSPMDRFERAMQTKKEVSLRELELSSRCLPAPPLRDVYEPSWVEMLETKSPDPESTFSLRRSDSLTKFLPRKLSFSAGDGAQAYGPCRGPKVSRPSPVPTVVKTKAELMLRDIKSLVVEAQVEKEKSLALEAAMERLLS